jgi:hypothetical protein
MLCWFLKNAAIMLSYVVVHAARIPSQPLILVFSDIHVCIRCSTCRLICGSTFLFNFDCDRLAITVVSSSVAFCRLRTTESVVGHPFHLQLADIRDLVRGIDELEGSAYD